MAITHMPLLTARIAIVINATLIKQPWSISIAR
jgi:hypothetical protein